ncbi:MAG: hypothetical protein M1837_007366 [Sclerophora amabilis]|nr:MAG: hypothetical protein M1837_007366 [Sclerophora amabilis]
MPQVATWTGAPSIKGSSESMRMAMLTFSLVGLQFTWGIEMTYCTPYLLQLGLTKSKTSLVWIAGPLSGLIMQPVIGVFSDRSKSKWGRRRPFMVGGAILVAICLLVLGWTAEIVGYFMPEGEARKSATVYLAVFSIYAVDFAINAVQSTSRSLIVDTLPIPKQQLGSAWASRMTAIGHLIGYAAGTIDLVKVFGTTFGDTQFKQLCLIAAGALLAAVAVTSYCVQERILIAGRDSDAQSGVLKMLSQIFKLTLHLPERIQAICWAQFWAWIGWFPFLFYGTTWVGETYFRYNTTEDAQKSKDALGDIGRIGSLSMVIFSIITFVGSIVLPLVVKSPDKEKCLFTPRPPPVLASILRSIGKARPDLLTAWTIGHLVFATTMIMAPFVRSVAFATTLVSICGISWALASWAPFAFMGIEINKLGGPSGAAAAAASGGHSYHPLSNDSFEPSSPTASISSQSLRLSHRPRSFSDVDEEPPSSTGELAGIYLGILNLFTTLPQFVGTFISMIVFSILEPGKSPELAQEIEKGEKVAAKQGPNAIAVCLFIGALSSVVAAVATQKIKHV